MTDFERPRGPGSPTGAEDTVLDVEDRERHGASFLPISRQAALWRWGFPLVVLAIIVWSAVLLLGGLQTILDSEEGRTREAITDPAAPGFEAFVEQTWSMLVVTEDEAGGLAQVAVVAVADRESGGGTVMLIPSELVTAGCPTGVCRLDDVYRDGGVEALHTVVARRLDVEFTDATLLTPPRWATLVGPVAPIPVEVEHDLIETGLDGTTVIRFPAGEVRVAADDVVAFMAFSDDGADQDRLQRQGTIWRSWLAQVRTGGNTAVNLPGIDLPVVEVAATLAAGPTVVVDSLWSYSGGELVVDPARLEQRILDMFPFPIPLQPGQRATVRLLNGTGDPSFDAPARKAVRKAGADVIVVGNFRNDHVIQTRVVYRDPEMAEKATALAAALGTRVIHDDMVSPVADLTVLVGKDFHLLKG